VVSSLDFNTVQNIVNKYFENWETEKSQMKQDFYEINNPGKFIKNKAGIQGAKIQYCFPIDKLNHRELAALKIFNLKFGEGTSSILYDKIRTENGLSYEVYSYIKNEAGIKLFTICMGTSNENIEKAIEITNNLITNISSFKDMFTESEINKAVNAIKLKRELKIEKSIELSKELATSEIMYGEQRIYKEENFENITEDEIYKTINKVLVSPTIQVLSHESL
jgi:predicted Zn-dependent peptidase